MGPISDFFRQIFRNEHESGNIIFRFPAEHAKSREKRNENRKNSGERTSRRPKTPKY